MATLYESWHESGGDWKKSKIYLNITSKEKNKRMGVREWVTRKEIVDKYGEEGAKAIIEYKLSTPELKDDIRDHPEAPGCESMKQFLVLNMDKHVESNETVVSRLYEAAEEESSSSGSSSDSNSGESSDSESSSSIKKKKKKKTKGKKDKKSKKKKGKGSKTKAAGGDHGK